MRLLQSGDSDKKCPRRPTHIDSHFPLGGQHRPTESRRRCPLRTTDVASALSAVTRTDVMQVAPMLRIEVTAVVTLIQQPRALPQKKMYRFPRA